MWNYFSGKQGSNNEDPFVRDWKGLDSSSKGVYQYSEIFGFSYRGHVGEVNLPIHGRKDSSSLMSGKWGWSHIGVGVSLETTDAGSRDLLEIL